MRLMSCSRHTRANLLFQAALQVKRDSRSRSIVISSEYSSYYNNRIAKQCRCSVKHSASGRHRAPLLFGKASWSAGRNRSHSFYSGFRDIFRIKSYQTVDMEVTRHNFNDTLPVVKEALDECHFFSFDCEMTGLFVSNRNGLADGKPPVYLHDMEDRYEELLESSQSFIINQFGLSVFVWDGSCYKAKTFNFYTFPRAFEEWQPRFLSEASSLEFLSGHKFDFNKWIHDGVSFMPGSLRDRKLQMVENPVRRNEIVPASEQDKMLVADLKNEVRRWLGDEDSQELLLNPVNAYQRAIQYQELKKNQFGAVDPPGFYPEKVISESGRAFIKLVKASSEQVKKREEELLEKRRQEIIDAAGFAQIMDLLRESKKPAVGHNLSFDVAYSLHCFVSPLPPSWEEYRKLVQWQFPGGLFDTKHIAKTLFGESPEPIETSLGILFRLLTVEEFSCDDLKKQVEAAEITPRSNLVVHDEGFEDYAAVAPGECAHEAGYDAFMTGAVFACLVEHASTASVDEDVDEELIDMEKSFEIIESMVWKMHVTRSDFEYASLAGPQLIPDRDHIVYVCDIPDEVQLRRGNDLTRALTKRGFVGARATILENGRKALIEFPDTETADASGKNVLLEIFKGAQVNDYSVFREELRIRREEVISTRRQQSKYKHRIPFDSQTKPSKKPRQDDNNSGDDKGTKCSVM